MKVRSFSIATIIDDIKKLEFAHIARMVLRDGFSTICNLFITYFLYEKFGFTTQSEQEGRVKMSLLVMEMKEKI